MSEDELRQSVRALVVELRAQALWADELTERTSALPAELIRMGRPYPLGTTWDFARGVRQWADRLEAWSTEEGDA